MLAAVGRAYRGTLSEVFTICEFPVPVFPVLVSVPSQLSAGYQT